MFYYGLKLKEELEKYGFYVETTRTDFEKELQDLIESKFSSSDGISLKKEEKKQKGSIY